MPDHITVTAVENGFEVSEVDVRSRCVRKWVFQKSCDLGDFIEDWGIKQIVQKREERNGK